MEKRGQLTVFIIVGLFLLAFVGILLYFRQGTVVQEPAEPIPEELIPMRNYIEACMQKTAQDAVVLLGMQGGYVYLPERIKYDPLSYISIGGVDVPLWYYSGSSRMPSIEGMQDEISRYVKENVDLCFRNFESFSGQYEVVPESDKTVVTRITDGTITFKMEYLLAVKTKGTEVINKMSKFNSDLKVDLKKVYELSREIYVAEQNQMFFEDVTIDLMAAGSDIPFTDMSFECTRKEWRVDEIEKKIKDILYYNLPKTRIEGTDYEPFLEHYSKYELLRAYTPQDIAKGKKPDSTPADAYDYFHFLWNPTQNQYKNLLAHVNFDRSWNFLISARPSTSGVMRASWDKGDPRYYLSYLCINAYHFTYDLVYPIELVVRDPAAFNGNGYTFRFALPVMINHNKGDKSNFDSAIFESPEGRGGEYCNDRRDNEIMIIAKNKKTMEEIPNVNITFNCMNVYYCDLGKTDFAFGSNRLMAKLPTFCSPPTLEATHRDYAKASKTVSEDSGYTDIMMTPLKKMNFRVLKQRLTGNDLQPIEDLAENETAVIYLSTNYLDDFTLFRKYPIDTGAPDEMTSMKLPDDKVNYRLEIILLSRDNQIIGGFRGNITISDKDMMNKDTITFKAVEKIPHPGTTEGQADLILMLEGGAYNNKLMPVIS